MAVFEFHYHLGIRMSEAVESHSFLLRCKPGNDARQQISDLQISISPADFLSNSTDAFGNNCIYGSCGRPHTGFKADIRGTAVTGPAICVPSQNPALDAVFAYPSPLTAASPALRAFASLLKVSASEDAPDTGAQFQTTQGRNAQLRSDCIGNAQLQATRICNAQLQAACVCDALHGRLKYLPGVTTVQTTAAEAFDAGCGVCQDYAHIMLALMRIYGIPARYVTGMVPGEGKSHAWVEVLCDGMWYGFDPTNGVPVEDRHIKLSHGRDASDCPINRGVFRGIAEQETEISVIVHRKGR